MPQNSWIFKANCNTNDLFEMLAEYAKKVNELADELAHIEYTKMIVSDEMANVAGQFGFNLTNPLKNYKRPDFSVASSAYYRIVDAEDKLKKNHSAALERYNFKTSVVFVSYGDGFIIKLESYHEEFAILLKSNGLIQSFEYEQEKAGHNVPEEILAHRKEVIDSIDFSDGYSRELYKGIQGLRPKHLLSLLNTQFSFPKRLRLCAEAMLIHELSQSPSFNQKSEVEIQAYMVTRDAEVRKQAYMAQVGPLLCEEFDSQYLLRKE